MNSKEYELIKQAELELLPQRGDTIDFYQFKQFEDDLRERLLFNRGVKSPWYEWSIERHTQYIKDVISLHFKDYAVAFDHESASVDADRYLYFQCNLEHIKCNIKVLAL